MNSVSKKTKILLKRGRTFPRLKWLSTRLLDDVFTDEVSLFRPHFKVDYEVYLQRLWDSNPEIFEILQSSSSLESARDALYNYLDRSERQVFALDNDLHILEKSTVRECVRVFRSIIGPINEHRTEFSALDTLWKLARNRHDELKEKVSPGFIMEFINLFRGVTGKSNIYMEDSQVKKGIPEFLKMKGRKAAIARTEILDELGSSVNKYLKKYPSGFEDEVIARRVENWARILHYFNGTPEDWNNYKWHLKHIIQDSKPLKDLIELSAEQIEAIDKAVKNKIAFGITPYYLSLMDSKLSIGYDHAIRAQVIPPKEYVDLMVEHRGDRRTAFDFMGEHDTSPIDLITRRYPIIAILNPLNS
ncbi:MAG: hypothetical protein V1715_02525 [bacterium]